MVLILSILVVMLYAIATFLASYSAYLVLKDPIVGIEGKIPFTIGYSLVGLVLSIPIILSYAIGHKMNYDLLELFSAMFVIGLVYFVIGQVKAKKHISK